jgi:hypothetical protein
MRWWVALPLFAALAVGAAGCRSSCARVESELRAREEDVRTLKEEVDRLGCTNEVLSRELSATRGEPGPDGIIHKPSEPYPVRCLALGRQTGGWNDEGCGGDSGLIVIVEPRDCDDQAIKAPGALVIDVIETPREGESRPLWRYEISPDELRHSWQSGLFSTGYRLTLGFKSWPTTDRLRVVAHFRMMNGRVFEAGKDVVVRLPPEAMRRPLNAAPTAPRELPGRPAPERTLPPPNPEPTLPPPTPEKTLPPPDPVPNDPPPPENPPADPQGPILTPVKAKKPSAVQMFRPVPLRDE